MPENVMTLDEKILFIENLINELKPTLINYKTEDELFATSQKIACLKEIKETLEDYKHFVEERNKNKAQFIDIDCEYKPSREIILNYCRRNNIPQEIGEKFYDYYEKNNLWFNRYGNLINWEFALTKWINYGRKKPNIHIEDW